MKIQLLSTGELSEAQIKLMARQQLQEILKGLICPVCKNSFTGIDMYNAIRTGTMGDNITASHRNCLANRNN